MQGKITRELSLNELEAIGLPQETMRGWGLAGKLENAISPMCVRASYGGGIRLQYVSLPFNLTGARRGPGV